MRVPGHAPDWLPRAPVPGDDGKVNDVVMAQDLASLLYIINLGCIELHPLHSRAGSLDRPEFALFDLDPFEPYTFADVRTVAKLIKVVLDELDQDLEPNDFRIDNVWQRFEEDDRFAPVLTDRQTLAAALETLGVQPAEAGAASESEAAPPPTPDLSEYRSKRDFRRTPEPAGTARRAVALPEAPHAAGLAEPADLASGPVFCIQQHHARALHHDVRFERDGVLVSFAVPKRLPEVPGVRHLAVNTADHPMDYLTFSGSIPEGEYGAGEVRLFDLGTYEPLEVTDGKWTVRLHGSRYRGAEYHFVRTKQDWICLLGGRTPLPAPAAPPTFEPMMAQLVREPFDDEAWLFEVKWDGHRCLAALGGTTRLTSRTARDVTAQFPELDRLHRQLAARNAVVDGEIVAFDQDGRPSFQRMQDRFHRSPEELARHRGRVPIQFLAFDLLWLDGESLLELPLADRRARLAEVLVPRDDVRVSQEVQGRGTAFFDQIKGLGLEGVVAKRLTSQYRPGARSPDWRKVKALRRQDCVIVGWTRGKGGRSSTLGSLLLAVYDGGGPRYVGNVGTGFTHSFLERLLPDLQEREQAHPPVEVPPDPRLRGARWTRPELVCEVEYQGWTDDWRLRAPSFKGIRTDKLPEDCRREDVPDR